MVAIQFISASRRLRSTTANRDMFRKPLKWGLFTDVHFMGGQDLSRIAKTCNWITHALREQKVDRIFCLGDVFHHRNKVDIEALSAAAQFFDSLSSIGVPIHILVGNHDLPRFLPNDSSEIKNNPSTLDMLDLGILRSTNRIFVHKCFEKVNLDNVDLMLVPWLDDLSPVTNELATMSMEEKRRTVLMGHLEMNGAAMNLQGNGDGRTMVDIPAEASKPRHALYPREVKDLLVTFLGHFHCPQMLGTNSMYIGAPLQHNFGDSLSRERGIAIFEPENWSPPESAVYNSPSMSIPDQKGLKFLPNPDTDLFRVYRASDFILSDGQIFPPAGPEFSTVRGKRVRIISTSNDFAKYEGIRQFFLSNGASEVNNTVRDFVKRINPEQVLEASEQYEPFDSSHAISLADQMKLFIQGLHVRQLQAHPQEVLLEKGLSLLTEAVAQEEHELGHLTESGSFIANIESISMENFLGIRSETTIDLAEFPRGISFIRGPNGSGKSTIFEAVTWCLFGECLRSDMTVSDVINDRGNGDCTVKVSFSNGYVIERTRSLKPGASPKLSVMFKGQILEEFNSRDYTVNQKKLQGLLGIPLSSFIRTVVLGDHDSSSNFLNSRPSDRRDLIEQLSGIAIFDKCLSLNRTELKALQESCQVIKKELHFDAQKSEQLKKNISNNRNKIHSIEQEISSTKESQRNIEHRISELKTFLHKLKSSAPSDTDVLMEKEIVVLEGEVLVIKDKISQCNNNLKTKQASFDKVYARISSLSQQTCPTCSQQIEYSTVLELQQKYSSDLTSVSTALGSINMTLKELHLKQTQKQEQLNNLLVEKAKKQEQSRSYDSNDSSNGTLEEYDALHRHLSDCCVRMEQLTSEKLHISDEIANQCKELDFLNSSMREGRDLITKRETEEIPLLKFWEHAFSKSIKEDCFAASSATNLRSFCTAGSLKQINTHMETFMKLMAASENSEYLPVSLSPSLKIRGGFGKRSSGQRQRNLIAILLSLNLLARSHSLFLPNFLFLDEVFDKLDGSGQKAVFQLLSTLEIDHIWVITHSQHSFPADTPVVNVFMDHENGTQIDLPFETNDSDSESSLASSSVGSPE